MKEHLIKLLRTFDGAVQRGSAVISFGISVVHGLRLMLAAMSNFLPINVLVIRV